MLQKIQHPAQPEVSTNVETVNIGGLPIARLSRDETADLMIALTGEPRTGPDWPLIMTSANGEVVSRCAGDESLKRLLIASDLINADGQPLVQFSRALLDTPLPERVATTDLFHDMAKLAIETDTSFYMYGASPEENAIAVDKVKAKYPGLNLVGHCHGYLEGSELDAKIDEINELGPDILWVALGVPRELEFSFDYRSRLSRVGIIKTSGGLFNFLSGTRARAPNWMQATGFEWVYRVIQEPRRLFWRYFCTSPHAIYVMLTKSEHSATNDAC